VSVELHTCAECGRVAECAVLGEYTTGDPGWRDTYLCHDGESSCYVQWHREVESVWLKAMQFPGEGP
jgi:hypothetical protein